MRDVFVGLCLAVGALGGWVTAGSVTDWHPTLNKPSFNPTNWLFGPVWTILYAMTGVALQPRLSASWSVKTVSGPRALPP